MTITRAVSAFSCEPDSIWRLEEKDRAAAVIRMVNHCAREFEQAVISDTAADAQDVAMQALAALAGLFPDPGDEAHPLFQSLMGMILAARAGRTDHFLMRKTGQPAGMKRGYGHAYVGGFAISAVEILKSRCSLSERAALRHVAVILAALGLSLRKGHHDEPKPVTAAAIRNWRVNPQTYPSHNEIGREISRIHERNLTARNATTIDEVLAYLRTQAEMALQHARCL